MWRGILKDEYLDENGNLLPRFNGIVYQWMYAHRPSMPTDAAASPVVVTKNGRHYRFRPAVVVGKTQLLPASYVETPVAYEWIDEKHRKPKGAVQCL